MTEVVKDAMQGVIHVGGMEETERQQKPGIDASCDTRRRATDGIESIKYSKQGLLSTERKRGHVPVRGLRNKTFFAL